jgi:ubiquinone/menaquinone biosynthesis C-methylase UbiE
MKANRFLKKLKNKIFFDKYSAELDFWIDELDEYQKWYLGEKEIWGVPIPREDEKVKKYDLKSNAILTYLKHQQAKYLRELDLSPEAFRGQRILDIGAGPVPSATVFTGAEVYSLDPLLSQYVRAGFPLHFYDNVRFVNAPAEAIPVEDRFFDAVISVNAIDHVDDLAKTAREITRVLKPGGRFAMHVHYHKPTLNEPIEIDREIFISLFSCIQGLKQVEETSADIGGIYALWRNF